MATEPKQTACHNDVILSQTALKILSAETCFVNSDLRECPSWDNVTTLRSFLVSRLRPLCEYQSLCDCFQPTL